MPAICPNCETQFRFDWCQDSYMAYELGRECGYCETVTSTVSIRGNEVSLIHHVCKCGLIVSTAQESDVCGLSYMNIEEWNDIDWELEAYSPKE